MIRIILLLSLLLSPAICGGETILLDQSYLSYIKVCENGIRKGYDSESGKWYPYNDGSGWHIAYGHKIKNGENFTNGITEAQAHDLLMIDLNEAFDKARVYFEERGYDITAFDTRQIEIVLDYTFNGCLYSHPRFMNAVANSDLEGQRREYKRYAVLNGQRVELRDRNTRFFNRYLNS